MTSAQLPAGIAAYLGDPLLGDFWARVRRALEGNGGSLTGSVTVDLDGDAARWVAGLLGRPVPPGRRRLRLALLDEALRSSAAERGLAAVVGALTGSPIRDRPAERAGRSREWDPVWSTLEALLVQHELAGADWTVPWRAWLRQGILTRSGAEASLAAVQTAVPALRTVLDARPGRAAVRQLGELATSVAGDAHALDGDRLAGGLILRALSLALGVPVPTTSADRRAMWAAAGVATDAVSGSVLIWNLRPPGPDRWSAMMRERADLGLVTALTTAELRQAPAVALHPEIVFAVENPQVLQAATVAAVPAAVVCFSGNPSVAGWTLARAVGSALRYHGDFDWPGVAIAGRLVAAGARPWRMSGGDYEAAVRSTRAVLPLTGRPVDTAWDPALRAAMQRRGVAVHEEALTSVLLADLR